MAKKFAVKNGKFVIAIQEGVEKFVIKNDGTVDPDLEVLDTTIRFTSASDVMGYNFYIDTVDTEDSNSTYIGQMITTPIAMNKIYPGSALYTGHYPSN